MRSRDQRLIVAAVGVSSLGDLLAMVPLALLVASAAGGTPLAVSLLFVCLFGPSVVLGGAAGRVADRVENRALLIGASLAQAAAATALAFAGSLETILPLAAILGAGAAFAAPAEFGLVGAMAAGDALRRINGAVETARYAGMTAGPLLGGVLAAAGAVREALLLDAVSFLAVAACAWRLRTRRRVARETGPAGAGGGFAFLAREPVLRVVLPAAVGALAFFSVSFTAELFFVRDVLGAGELGYGAVLTGWTLGMVAGAALAARPWPAYGLAALALAAVAAQGLGLAAASLATNFAVAAVAFLGGGVAHGAKNVWLRTLLHEQVPDHLRGRAFAAYAAARNAAELGALALSGVLVVAAGARGALLLSGVAPLVIGLAALALLQTRRRTAVSINEGSVVHAHVKG